MTTFPSNIPIAAIPFSVSGRQKCRRCGPPAELAKAVAEGAESPSPVSGRMCLMLMWINTGDIEAQVGTSPFTDLPSLN